MTDKEDSAIQDPIEVIYKMLQDGKQKETALFITNSIIEILEEPSITTEAKTAISHIFACIYAWNDDIANARKCHINFLNDEHFYTNNKATVKSYLAIVFAKNNKEVITQILNEFPKIKSDFKNIYKAYLGSVINTHSEEDFDVKLIKEYNLLLQAKRLYVD